jgi:hypothetical protein
VNGSKEGPHMIKFHFDPKKLFLKQKVIRIKHFALLHRSCVLGSPKPTIVEVGE